MQYKTKQNIGAYQWALSNPFWNIHKQTYTPQQHNKNYMYCQQNVYFADIIILHNNNSIQNHINSQSYQ